jgi:IclR family transcriptional regulator, KDG regulon repressor
MIDEIQLDGVRYRNQATQRVLAVLSVFIGRDRVFGVSELSRMLGMSKNMVHRALTTLTGEGYLTRDASGQLYQLGYRVLELDAGATDEVDIGALCRPFLERLHTLTGESVYLAIIVGRSRVVVDAIQTHGPRVLRHTRGEPVALHCTKMSRVLLAYLSDGEIDAYLRAAAPLARAAPFPDPASETAEAVWADIHAIRQTRNVLWQNPQQHSATYAIFPILDHADRPHGIITVGGPWERFGMVRVEALLPAMTAILAPLDQQSRLFAAPPFLLDGA